MAPSGDLVEKKRDGSEQHEPDHETHERRGPRLSAQLVGRAPSPATEDADEPVRDCSCCRAYDERLGGVATRKSGAGDQRPDDEGSQPHDVASVVTPPARGRICWVRSSTHRDVEFRAQANVMLYPKDQGLKRIASVPNCEIPCHERLLSPPPIAPLAQRLQ